MLYVASVRHKLHDCPGKDPDLMREMASKLSNDNLSKKKIKILDAFIDQACFLQQAKTSSNVDHVCTFIVDVPSTSILTQLFAPFPVETTPCIKWQEVKE
jgi:hypothetical protein